MGDKNEKESLVNLDYPMLPRNNYVPWAIKMRVFMQAHRVWEAVKPRSTREVVDVNKDKMALAAIYHGITKDLFCLW